MCMLFGFSADRQYNIAPVLKTFFKHSERHPDGWGVAYYKGDVPTVAKEPVKATESAYIKGLTDVLTSLGIAHIRKATQGEVSFDNTHPFRRKDWLFAHNGSITEQAFLDNEAFMKVDGDTDSEKALELMRIKVGKETDLECQIECIENYLKEITSHGKVNLMFTDGKRLYAHTNMKGTLWMYKKKGLILFSTRILENVKDRTSWRPVPMNKLLVFKEGTLIYEGKAHRNEYVVKNRSVLGGELIR